jgi:hypothetical protein
MLAGSTQAAKGKSGGLTGKERRAVHLKSVEIIGDESLGILVRAQFAGKLTALIGRGDLAKTKVNLALQPESSQFSPARIGTRGPGPIGRTVAQTSSQDVGVVRDGRSLTFFNFGPGFSNVATAEVQVLGPGGASAIASGETVTDGSGPVAVPKEDLSCTGLTTELNRLQAALKVAQDTKAQAEKNLKEAEKFLDEIDSSFPFVNQLQTLIQKYENWKFNLVQVTTNEAVARTKKAIQDMKSQIKEISGTITDLEAQIAKVKGQLQSCSGPCQASLERSPGTPPYTAANHIRVQAKCSSPIKKVVIKSLSGDTFDACAQTVGTGTGCTASGDTLNSAWNQPANQQLVVYGRVTANADGNYQVTIYGDGDAVLHQFQATVQP